MYRISFIIIVAVFATCPGCARAADLAAEVRTVFAAKCAACHGPALAKRKGRFGYVLDLARVASNREMIVPGAPEESELWELVCRGEMPPDDSSAGALTANQKDSIRAWIAAGAPTPAGDKAPNVSPPVRQTRRSCLD